MKILFDARRSVHLPTGIGRIIDGLLSVLPRIDQKNQYLILTAEKNPLSGQDAPHFEVETLKLGLNSPAMNWIMPPIARRWKADVAYFPFWFMPLFMPCPTIVGIHDTIYSAYPQYLPLLRRLVYNFYTHLAVRSARRVQTISQHARSEIQKYFSVSANRIDVIYLDASSLYGTPPTTEAQNELAPFAINRPFMLYVGNQKPHKNLERLLRAYQSIQSQLDLDLVVVGTLSHYEDRHALPYLELSRRLGLETRVHFIGQISDEGLNTLYPLARFFIYPSLYEGFGIPPLEAMRCKTPVACSNTTSLPEVVGNAALTFDPGSISEIAQAMLALDRSPNLRQELVRNGSEQCRRFSWENSARQWLASLEKAVQGGSGTSILPSDMK